MIKLGIVKKFILLFTGIVLATALILNVATGMIVESNNRTRIEEDLAELRDNGSVFVRRAILVAGEVETRAGFAAVAANAAEELRSILGRDIGFYTVEGQPLYTTFSGDAAEPGEELAYAANGQTAYTLVRGETVKAYFAIPIKDAVGNQIGVARIEYDYTSLYEDGRYIQRTVFITSLVVLGVAVILLVVFMKKLVNPVRSLTAAMTNLSETPKTAPLLPVKTADEIGQLTEQYNKTAVLIKSQMNELEVEQHNLKNALAHRKDFYDNLTHELKTPITIMLGYAEMMIDGGMEDAEFNKKGVTYIASEARRLKDMVEGLLEVSKNTLDYAEKPCETDARELIEEVREVTRIKAERSGAVINAEIEEGLTVWGDREHIRRMLLNLTDNAIKYGTGRIDIFAEHISGGTRIAVKNTMADPTDDIDGLFLPRHRGNAKDEHGSVGLGLAICKGIADAHGGKIYADRQGDDICFTVELPNTQEEEA